MLTQPLGRPKNRWEDKKWHEEMENTELD
jgi:hypothetical protein